jgi:lipopolysaccharide export system protein LptA
MRHNSGSLLALLLLLPSLSAVAETGTNTGPITVEADRLELNQKSGISIYQGHVRLEQKGMLLQSDRLELHNDGKKLQLAIADGTPVHLEQTDPQTGELTRAEAQHMEYRFSDGQLELTGKAHLWRSSDEMSGNHLIYDSTNRTVRAFGNKQGNGRVKVILQPEKESGQ